MAKIFFLLTDTKKPISSLIRVVTGERFNHVSVAFDPSLREAHSFSMGADGYVRETLKVWPVWTTFELWAAEVEPEGLAAAKRFVAETASGDSSFSYAGLVATTIGVPLPERDAKFCSEFVEHVAIAAGLKPSASDPTVTTPGSIVRRHRRRLTLVASGNLIHHIAAAALGRRPASLREGAGWESLMTEEQQQRQVLIEGFGSFIRNLATGDIEEEVKDIVDESHDVHTPEQQRVVLTKIAHLLEKLIVMRHNPGFIQKTVHDAPAWFAKMIGNSSGDRELKVRVGESIQKLAAARDKLLAKRWENDAANKKLEELRGEIAETLKKAQDERIDLDD